jgi:hypothetical protein
MDNARGTYPLPEETLPGLSVSEHLNDIAALTEFLQGRGIITQGTRIDRYAQYLTRVSAVGAAGVDASTIFKNAAPGPFESPVDWLLYVLREVHELMWILKGLQAHEPKGIAAKLKTVVGGRDFAALDVDSSSRNTQFELRIASYYCQAGWDVDLSSDTDIVGRTSDYTWYIECKRVASGAQLGKRLSEGRAQLSKRMPRRDGSRRVAGAMAVDVTKLAFSHNGLTWAMTNEHSRDIIRSKLVDVADSSERLIGFSAPRQLLCYWLQVHIASLIIRPAPVPATRFSSLHVARPNLSKAQAAALIGFYGAFESASRVDDRAAAPRRLEPRRNVTIPAGSRFAVHEHDILRLLGQHQWSDLDQEVVVASLWIDSQEFAFSFFELMMLPTAAINAWRDGLAHDAMKAHLDLLAQLYVLRRPYLEPGE